MKHTIDLLKARIHQLNRTIYLGDKNIFLKSDIERRDEFKYVLDNLTSSSRIIESPCQIKSQINWASITEDQEAIDIIKQRNNIERQIREKVKINFIQGNIAI